MNYGVTFPILGKVDVRGETAIPLFRYLSDAAPVEAPEGEAQNNDPKWNFTKFIVDSEGQVAARFEPRETPASMEAALAELLK
ncbi:hypothetical protein D3C84_1066650 [compost metagenome]